MYLIKRIISSFKDRWSKILFYRNLPKSTRIPRDAILAGYDNLFIEEDVYIGPRLLIYCTSSKVTIHRKVTCGPGLTIIAGNHNYHEVGQYICDVKNKRIEDDQDVEIHSDVWIGCNVTILKGVTINRGSIVAAGAVVTKTFPPYSVIGGVPAKIISKRFTEGEITLHEKRLYNK